MNIEQFIKALVSHHDRNWFNAIKEEFLSNKFYDNKTNSIRYELETLEYVPSDFDENGEPTDHYEKTAIYNIVKDLREYCWSNETPQRPLTSTSDLNTSFEALIENLSSTLTITNDVGFKHKIILQTREILRGELVQLLTLDEKLFNDLLNNFFQKFRLHLNQEYANILYFSSVGDDFKKVNKPAKTVLKLTAPVDIKSNPDMEKERVLDRSFFQKMFRLVDSYSENIIDDYHSATKYGDFFHLLYSGENPEPITIDFLWNKGPICYLISRIIATHTKLELKTLEELQCLSIKGNPFSATASSTAASKFRNNSSTPKLKALIDNLFDQKDAV